MLGHSHHMPKSPSRKTADLEIAIADASRSSGLAVSPTRKVKAQAGRIMYIECKAGGLTGTARIGRVTFPKTGRTFQIQLLLRGDRRGFLDFRSEAQRWRRALRRQLAH